MKRLLFVAVSIVVLCMLAQPVALHAQAKGKSMNATGMVKSVSGDSLTISGPGGKDMTFMIDSNTKFVGKGLSTKKRTQGKLTVSEAVAADDRVMVSYTGMEGSMHASNVKILNKSMMKK